MKPWTDGTKAMVLMVYGLVIGTVIVFAMLFVALPRLLENGMALTDWGAFIVMMLLGLVASLPTIFMQYLGSAIQTVREKIGGGASS